MEIVVALISAILGPLVVYFIKEQFDKGKRPCTDAPRLGKLIGGVWTGKFVQDEDNEVGNIVYPATFSLSEKRRVIYGSGYFENPSAPGKKINIILNDGVFDGRVLKLDYQDTDPHVFRKGTVILILDDLGESLSGRFVGYSPNFSEVIFGYIEKMKKLEPS